MMMIYRCVCRQTTTAARMNFVRLRQSLDQYKLDEYSEIEAFYRVIQRTTKMDQRGFIKFTED